ncbi:hypothetical protein [Pseudomonas sp. NA-150]|uniref:hypothetical protein n=1 Tax=Pseudomonas sp. NA-150 TaxID=3367525 RepID=UPI0037C9F0A9
MFGLSAEDGWALADLLGGASYHKALTSGALRTSGDQPDILDVLMQMDWAVTWLKETKLNISTVRGQIGLDTTTLVPTQALIDRLERLHQDVEQTQITEQQVQQLNLPTSSPTSFNWFSELKRTLINDGGLVKALPLQPIEDVKAQLATALNALIKPLKLSDAHKTQVETKLCELLLIAHDRQLRLIEGLLQEVANLPMDRAAVVTHWAGLSAETLLTTVNAAAKKRSLTLESFDPELLQSLQRLFRHAHIAQTFNLSELALRLFLASPLVVGHTHRNRCSVLGIAVLARTL